MKSAKKWVRPVVHRVLRRFGYRLQHVTRSGYPLDFGRADVSVITAVRPFTLTSPERIYALRHAVRYIVDAQVPGAIVECGVWKGGSMMVVAQTLVELDVHDRPLYLFDTFTGMTEPTEVDVNRFGAKAQDLLSDPDGGVWARAPLEGVRRAMQSTGYDNEMIHYIQGPVETTIPSLAPEAVALLRLDTDWYESTKHELVHLFPRLQQGGVLLIDDYGDWHGARKATDEFLREADPKLLLNRIDETGRVAVKV